MHRREAVKIEVPKDESVPLGRVGLIALAGFVIGVLWPRLAGMQLVPSAPGEEDERPKELASASPQASAKAASAKALAKSKPESKSGPAETAVGDRIKIAEIVITSCRNASDAERKECDDIPIDDLARSRLLTLAACPAGEGKTGLLSVGFDLDFEKNSVSNVRTGKSTSFDDATAKALVGCVKDEFKSATLADIKHAYNEYTVFYKVEFLPEVDEAAGAAAEAEESIVEASGRATVGWQVALIRKVPRDGEVVARILSGTNVIVTGRQGDWYRVKYDGKGNQGWVYRSAIGL